MYITLVPAYGRDYKSGKAVQADWDANKDFLICDMFSPWDGKPINKEQATVGCTYNIRYKGKTQIKAIKHKGN